MERLQKVLAAAGVGSRRACEDIILAGRVQVDRTIVTTLGVKVDTETQLIRVDGSLVKPQRLEYYLVNKPPGVVSTSRDPSQRMRVVDLVKSNQRIFTVGRLDKSSEGLMIVTNDGALAQKLTHPKFGCHKTYTVTVAGLPTVETLKQLKDGIHLADGFAQIHDFRVKKRSKTCADLEIILKEGRNREIRRLLARIGHKVLKLKRIAIGPIRLGDLPVGAHRRIEGRELKKLQNFQADAPQKRRHKATKRKSSTARSSSDRPNKSTSRVTKKKSSSRTSTRTAPGASRRKSTASTKGSTQAGGRGRIAAPKKTSKKKTTRKKVASKSHSRPTKSRSTAPKGRRER